MFKYRVKFLGGSELIVRADSPRLAWNKATETYGLEVISIKHVR